MVLGFEDTGLGDAWMRMLALAVLAELTGETQIIVSPPKAVVPLAQQLFQEYFIVSTHDRATIRFTHFGIRKILSELGSDYTFYPSFYWLLRNMRPTTTAGDRLSDLCFWALAKIGKILLPDQSKTFLYQGYMELSLLKPFKNISWDMFVAGSETVLPKLSSRLRENVKSGGSPIAVAVFPSGTAHQILPPQLAATVFPEATYFFHRKDNYANAFIAAGLNVEYFETSEGILGAFARSKTIVCTDSFPSHLAQTWITGCHLLMSQQKSEMVVIPSFAKSHICRSVAPCHPCRSRARQNDESLCDAGKFYCKTWSSPEYIAQMKSIAI